MEKIEKYTRLLHAFMSKDKCTIEEMYVKHCLFSHSPGRIVLRGRFISNKNLLQYLLQFRSGIMEKQCI